MKSADDVREALKQNGLEETPDILRNCLLRDNEGEWAAYYWMEEYFHFTGDHMPNSKEIHLDYVPLNELYATYTSEVVENLISYTTWKNIWDNLFSHVKIRVYKQVTGKCFTCTQLSELRNMFAHVDLKKIITNLHEMHRATYMGERLKYYERRQEAMRNPDEVHSAIVDGMSQGHSNLPHFANNYSAGVNAYKLKLMGVLDHGRKKFSSYLCFPCVQSGSSLTIDCLQRNLDDWIEEKRKYPKKIYWQVDGAGDNANKIMLAYCEYLVSVTPIEEIVLSRLPVGHTHEDIDAHFGTIWETCRLLTISSVNEYAMCIKRAFSNIKVDVIKLFSVQDYDTFFQPYIDKKLHGYAKLLDTKLQFRFKKTTLPNFPNKVQVSYRAFAEDSAILLAKGDDIPKEKRSEAANSVNMQALRAKIYWEPKNKITGNLIGQYHLLLLPRQAIRPLKLVEGSKNALDTTIDFVISKYLQNSSQHLAWQAFADEAPASDDVQMFLRTHQAALIVRSSVPGRDVVVSNVHNWVPFQRGAIFTEYFAFPNLVSTSKVQTVKDMKALEDMRRLDSAEGLLEIESTASVQTSIQPRYILFYHVLRGFIY